MTDMHIAHIREQIKRLPTTYQRTQATVALARLICAKRARMAGDLIEARAEIANARARLRDLELG